MSDETTDNSASAAIARAATGAEAAGGYLGDPEVIADLARQYLGEVAVSIDDYMRDKVTQDQSVQHLADECTAFTAILCGQNEAYTPVGEWNGAGLARSLVASSGVDLSSRDQTDPADVIGTYLATIAGVFMQAIEAHTNGDMTDQAFQAFTNATLQNMRADLMGTPSNAT